ncbi:MAG TPA: Crp/Fnr family transcriptional regulator [Solirubrobacteraceae bacterium]|jgi:CRP/FNR family transcriptional regulator, cyclic AMP receptor protein|nr:Crp/Fnr family transcriptional regulator [Solirubrobacteraceae bacterium]
MASDDIEQPIERTRQRPRASYCYLLDADADLAQEFDIRMRMVVRQVATVVVFEIGVGDCDPAQWSSPGAASPGMLLLDGTIAVDVQVGNRTATELLGPGDLLQPWDPGADELLERSAKWHVLLPGRVAILDAGFAERIRPWPQILLALLRRAGKRASDLDVQRAIACQPRLEVRLALLLWHLGARWGKVEPGGVRISLPLTHRLLGQLIGAERPSVSHALGRLAEAGLVTGRADEWHLHGTVEHHLACLVGRDAHAAPHARAGGHAPSMASRRG